VVLAVIACGVAWLCLADWRNPELVKKFEFIAAGMDLSEVESRLGPGVQTDYCPGVGHEGSAVHGDTYYHWLKNPRDDFGPAIWVGVRDHKIVDKYMWQPSL
jgi:hypothetical protein